MLGVWCWYVFSYGMDLVEDVMYVYFVGMSDRG